MAAVDPATPREKIASLDDAFSHRPAPAPITPCNLLPQTPDWPRPAAGAGLSPLQHALGLWAPSPGDSRRAKHAAGDSRLPATMRILNDGDPHDNRWVVPALSLDACRLPPQREPCMTRVTPC